MVASSLLDYSVVPATVPCSRGPREESIVSLMLCATNDTGREVRADRIAFEVPTGPASGCLAARLLSVTAARGVEWDATFDASGVITITPTPPANGVGNGQSLAFFAELVVNDRPGMSVIRVVERTDETRRSELVVFKRPPGLAITRFQASRLQLAPGQESGLAWTVTGAEEVTLSYEGTSERVHADDTRMVKPKATTVYTLTAYSGGTSTAEQLTVYVPVVAIHSFRAEPQTVVRGAESELSWLLSNAESAYIRAAGDVPDPGEVKTLAGSQHVRATEPATTYTLAAEGFGTGLESSATVFLKPVLVAPLSASPRQIPLGAGPGMVSRLRWEVRDARALTIEPGIGAVDSVGDIGVQPAATTTYTLKAKDMEPTAATIVRTGGIIKLGARVEDLSAGRVTWATAGAAGVEVKHNRADWRAAERAGGITTKLGDTVAIRVSAAGWVNEAVIMCGGIAGDTGGSAASHASFPPGDYSDVLVTSSYGINTAGAQPVLTFNTNSLTMSGEVRTGRYRRSFESSGSFAFEVEGDPVDAFTLVFGHQRWHARTLRPGAG